jgi:hypothetical protein
MIDTLNAGQTCRRCRHYQAVHMVQDPFFGEHPVKDWCSKRKRHIEIADGADCRLFLRSMFKGGSRNGRTHGNTRRIEEALQEAQGYLQAPQGP